MKLIRFNTICVSILIGLFFGTFYIWRSISLIPQIQHVAWYKTEVVVDNTVVEAEVLPVVQEEYTVIPEQERQDTVTEVPTKLPNKIHLTVPFTSQAPEKNWDQPWQDACEEAAILMLDAYEKGYGLSPLFARDEILKQVAEQTEQGLGGSIDVIDVRDVAATYMHVSADSFTIVRHPEVTEMKQYLAAGNPIVALADGKVLPNPFFSAGGPVYHAFLIIGYDDATQEFITNDPGTQHGKDLRYTYDDLMGALHDWNNGDVPNGTPVILVRD